MAVDVFFVTSELCHRHREWRKNNVNGWDYLTFFCDDFARYMNKQSRHKPFTPIESNIWMQLKLTNKSIITTTVGDLFVKGQICNQKFMERVSGFCDITDYLKYITTDIERQHCILGLWMFMDFGGIVRIGSKDFTFLDSTAMDNEILKLTPHI